MFTRRTKILAGIFTACLSSTVIAAIRDDNVTNMLDSEDAICRIREETDPEYYSSYHKRLAKRVKMAGEIDDPE